MSTGDTSGTFVKCPKTPSTTTTPSSRGSPKRSRQYFEKGEFERTLELCEEALAIANEEDNPRLFVILHGRHSSTYQNLGRYEQAIDYALDSIAMSPLRSPLPGQRPLGV